MSEPLEFSIVLSTYNRGELLGDAIRSLLALSPDSPPHELIVVDNNSRDRTREIVESFVPGSGGRLRYVFEGRQGLSNARNAGIAASRGRFVAFTDDDVRAEPDWLVHLARAFREHPEAVFAGGKVLPMWPSPPPRWLHNSKDNWNWSPLALLDHGDEGFETGLHRAVCLVGANVAFKREVFDRFGGFEPYYQHEKGAVSAVEDHEFELRLYHAGLKGWYEPAAVIHAEIQPNRLKKAYHRKWHFDHGRAMIRMLPPDHMFDWDLRPTPLAPTARRLLNAPLYLFRRILELSARWLTVPPGEPDRRFYLESEVRETIGMIHCYYTSRAPGTPRPPTSWPPIPRAADAPAADAPAADAPAGAPRPAGPSLVGPA